MTFSSRLQRCLTLVLIVLSIEWRLYGLGDRCLWFDEAHSWQLSRFPWRELVWRCRLDVHPPLYFAALKLWTGVLGDSVYAMRLLSVAWFVAGLGAAALLAREGRAGSGGRSDAGVVAVLLLCSSSFLFRYCQEVRMYTQELALFLTSSWLLLRAQRGGPGRAGAAWWSGYGLSAAALAYTHNFGLIALASQWAYVAARGAAG